MKTETPLLPLLFNISQSQYYEGETSLEVLYGLFQYMAQFHNSRLTPDWNYIRIAVRVLCQCRHKRNFRSKE